MNALLLALLLATASPVPSAAADYRWQDGVRLPDPETTPGQTHQVPLTALCRTGYTDTVRYVTRAQERRVFTQYRIPWSARRAYEIDHFVPLGLAGSNADRNLWPQPFAPRPGAREKDALELFLRRAVCSGAVPLAQAQRDIQSNWWKAYQRMKRGEYP